MVKIQIIPLGKVDCKKYDGCVATFSSFTEYDAFDDYDFNIIDSSLESFWEDWIKIISDTPAYGQSVTTLTSEVLINSTLKNIYDAIRSCKTNVILVSPKNFQIKLNGKFCKMSTFCNYIGTLFGVFLIGNYSIEFVAEKTITELGGLSYSAPFSINWSDSIIESKGSKKTTMARICDGKYVTTLNVFETPEHLQTFISKFLNENKETAPPWFNELECFDDRAQKDKISDNEEEIQILISEIDVSKSKLDKNNRFKSILYTSSTELVEVVFEMLEEMIGCDLSSFVDVHREDFRFVEEGCTYLGEIKGVNENLKSSHISQLDVHYQKYNEGLEDKGKKENVKAILIINRLRNVAPNERKPVHEDQIKLARINGHLVIDTETLLRLYESFVEGKRTSADCIKILKEEKGFLII